MTLIINETFEISCSKSNHCYETGTLRVFSIFNFEPIFSFQMPSRPPSSSKLVLQLFSGVSTIRNYTMKRIRRVLSCSRNFFKKLGLENILGIVRTDDRIPNWNFPEIFIQLENSFPAQTFKWMIYLIPGHPSLSHSWSTSSIVRGLLENIIQSSFLSSSLFVLLTFWSLTIPQQ